MFGNLSAYRGARKSVCVFICCHTQAHTFFELKRNQYQFLKNRRHIDQLIKSRNDGFILNAHCSNNFTFNSNQFNADFCFRCLPTSFNSFDKFVNNQFLAIKYSKISHASRHNIYILILMCCNTDSNPCHLRWTQK